MRILKLTKRAWGPDALRDSRTRKQCCLGTYLRVCGIPAAQIKGLAMPSEVLTDHAGGKMIFPKEARWLVDRDWGNTVDAQALAEHNDTYFNVAELHGKHEAGRVRAGKEKAKAGIRKLFARHKVRVVFEKGL